MTCNMDFADDIFPPRALRSGRSDYLPAPTEPERPKRSRYEEKRRKEVGIVRNIGACYRCRLLKTGVSWFTLASSFTY